MARTTPKRERISESPDLSLTRTPHTAPDFGSVRRATAFVLVRISTFMSFALARSVLARWAPPGFVSPVTRWARVSIGQTRCAPVAKFTPQLECIHSSRRVQLSTTLCVSAGTALCCETFIMSLKKASFESVATPFSFWKDVFRPSRKPAA